MAWYKTGTVSVTNGSPVVTGSGTAFVANVQPGQGVLIDGSGRIYEIVAVNSNTEIELAENYLSATATGQPYEVVPIVGYPQHAADALREALTYIKGFASKALAGRFPNGSAASPGIAFENDENTGIFRAGVDKIGLATNGIARLLVGSSNIKADLPVVDANGREYYRPGNVIGPVSVSSGEISGAVIERGSNASGEYVRYADGTQICFARVTKDLNTTDIESFTHPAAFVDVYSMSVSAVRDSITGGQTDREARWLALSRMGQGASTLAAEMRCASGALTAQTVSVNVTTFGRWR